MTDDPRRPVSGDPLGGGGDRSHEGERDAFGNPVAPGSSAPHPADQASAPPSGSPPSTPEPASAGPAGLPPPPPPLAPPGAPLPGAPPPGTSPSTPPGYAPSPTPPGYASPPTPPGYASPPSYPPPASPGAPGAPALHGHVLADWGSRVGAAALNFVFRMLAGVPAVAAFVAGSEVTGVILAVLAWIWAVILYAPVFMMRRGKHNGQSPGKQLVGIRVVRLSGEPMSFGGSVLREFVVKSLVFDFIGGFVVLGTLINYAWPLWDEQNRALHDMVVSTRVVKA